MNSIYASEALDKVDVLKSQNNGESVSASSGIMNAHVLSVVSGTQKGASMLLQIGSEYFVGADIDNDVVLVTGSDQTCNMRLESRNANVNVHVLSGELIFKNESLRSGDTCILELLCNSIIIGSTQIEVQFNNNIYVSDDKSLRGMLRLKYLTSMASGTVLRRLTYVTLFAGFLLLFGSISTGIVRAVNIKSQTQTFEQVLTESGYAHLNYIAPLGGIPARISGSVQTNEEKLELLRLAEAHGLLLETDLQINDELRLEIENLYRINDITAKVDIVGIGEIFVWTSTNEVEKLEMIEQNMKEDFSSLVSVTTSNTPPEDNVLISQDDPFAGNVPGKRITLIVAGVDGYIMTKDKARYFVGSTLPSGHIITKIDNGSVYVKAGEETMVLNF